MEYKKLAWMSLRSSAFLAGKCADSAMLKPLYIRINTRHRRRVTCILPSQMCLPKALNKSNVGKHRVEKRITEKLELKPIAEQNCAICSEDLGLFGRWRTLRTEAVEERKIWTGR